MKKTERHNYDLKLIQELCKKQPKDNFNCTDVAKKYAKKVGLEYDVSIARQMQKIIRRDLLNKSFDKPSESTFYKDASKNKVSKKVKNYIVTWAQSHTPILKNLWIGMQRHAEEINAQIIVIPGTYLNYASDHKKIPTVWDENILGYLHAREDSLHPYLRIIPDADILPTASMPLSGLEAITGLESSIVGHPRHHKMVVPTMKNSRRKYMATTGAITLPNYRRARVGKKAIANHKMGFLVVECFDKENFTLRHVESDLKGNFQDLIFKYQDGDYSKNGRFKTMVFGDTHLGKDDFDFLEESRRIFDIGKTEMSVWHDLFDGYSINHHQQKDYVAQVIKERKGLNSLQEELNKSIEFVDKWKDTNMYIIPSNHNDWLDKWVCLNQGIKDIKNAPLFNEFQKVLFNEEAPKGLYAYVLDKEFGDEITTLGRDESLSVGGIEMNNHGDLGANGAKGTPLTFKKLNTKIISADKHTLYTYDNAYGVGVSGRLDHGYNRGLTSWCQSNGIILETNNFQHLIYEGGKFTNLV